MPLTVLSLWKEGFRGVCRKWFTWSLKHHIGVLFCCFGRKIDGPGLPGGLIIYQGNPSISPKRTPMVKHLVGFSSASISETQPPKIMHYFETRHIKREIPLYPSLGNYLESPCDPLNIGQ